MLLLQACTSPIAIKKVDPEKAYLSATRSPLSGNENSNAAVAILQRYGLRDVYEKNPSLALEQLHANALKDDRRDILFALAELNYSWAKSLPAVHRSDDPGPPATDIYLQSAVYAYLYLLGPGKDPQPNAYDNRFREACELYNRGLAQAFLNPASGVLVIKNETRALPDFKLAIEVKTDTLHWLLKPNDQLLPADSFEVDGFSTKNRTAGLGAPIIAVTTESKTAPTGGVVPITAFLQINGSVQDLSAHGMTVTLDLISSTDDTHVVIDDKAIPLQTDSTTPLAYRLNNNEIWSSGFERFIFNDNLERNLLFIEAYDPEKIPVVLVHGTGSSPIWWAEMVNTLRGDPLLHAKYQFWFYEYTSSLPIPTSAADLRDTLSQMVNTLDPKHTSEALRHMVVIGHSQGGLLTHMTAIDPGDEIWRSISDKAFADFKVDPVIKMGFQRALFFKPLPFVTRLIFISTPHRGSFITEDWVRTLAHAVIGTPARFLSRFNVKWNEAVAQLKLPEGFENEMPTSVDGMNSKSPVMRKVASLPLAPHVKAHSIIAVLPQMDILTGNDGVVDYQSAHLEGVDSEFIVRGDHSAQENPIAIDEVRRILHVHCSTLPSVCTPTRNSRNGRH
jgi:pimeloyl-ACP methyl ester carboxylesterase